MTAPRGIRNKNPGNIEASGWTQRQDGYQGREPEGRFAVFQRFEDGIAAHIRLLRVYRDKHGLTTIRGIINRWAPPEDANDVSAYASHVSHIMGVGVDDPLPDDGPTFALLAYAMACHENGERAVNDLIPRNAFTEAQAIVFGPQPSPIGQEAAATPSPSAGGAPTPQPLPAPPPLQPTAVAGGGEGGIIFTDSPAPATSEDKPMPIHAALVSPLISTLAGAIKEFGELFLDSSTPPRVRNVQAATLALTKIAEATRPAGTPPAQWNEQRAVEAVLTNPESAAKARSAIIDDYDRLLGMTLRAQAGDDASRDAAAARARGDDPVNAATGVLIYGALGGAATVFFAIVVLLIVQSIYMPDHKPMGELVALFIGTCGTIIGFATAIYLYRFGSSAGSKASGDAVRAIAEAKR